MAEVPKLLRVPDVLERLQGAIGRNKLLQHLKCYPEHNGGPTHRRIVGRIVFHPDDIIRLIDSLECLSKSSHANVAQRSTSVEPSVDKVYMKALELVTPNKQKPTGRSGRRSYGRPQSMGSAQQ